MSEDGSTDQAPIYSQTFTLEDARARISGHVARGQNDAWFPPAPPFQTQPAFQIRLFAVGAPITIRFRALRQSPQPAPAALMVSATPGGAAPQPAPREGSVVFMRRPPIERPGSFGTVGVFDPIDPPPPLPPDPPSTSVDHAPCTIRLYPPGSNEPAQTWKMEGGPALFTQQVEFAPHVPIPGSAAFSKGWWRCTLTVEGPDPARVWLKASGVIGHAPFQTRRLSKRLMDRMVGVVLDALTPDVRIRGSELTISIGRELAELYDIVALNLIHSIDVVSYAKLRTFSVELVSGLEVIAAAQAREDRAKQQLDAVPGSFPYDTIRITMQLRLNQARARREQLQTSVQSDFVALKIKAAFQDATVRAYGFDIGSLQDDIGEIYIAFNHSLSMLVPSVYVVFNYTLVGEIAELLGLTPIDDEDVDDLIRGHIITHEGEIRAYLRETLGRLVARLGEVVTARAVAGGWDIRYFENLPEPTPANTFERPGAADHPMFDGGAVVAQPTDSGAPPPDPTPDNPPDTPPVDSDDAAAPWPDEFVVAGGEALDRLDKIGTLVVVMMENRSFDHLLGDLARVRPRANDAYTCRPAGASNPAAGGFTERIPVVPAADIGLDTAIGVSPHHSFSHVGFQMGGGDAETSGSGAMEGFTRDIMDRADAPQIIMSYYGESDLPTYYRLADEFMVCDHWFCAQAGATCPNRWATLNGTIPEIDNLAIDDPRFGFLESETIFGILDRHNIDWRYYESDVSMVRMFDRYRLDDEKVLPIDDPEVGLAALLKSPPPLPRVIFVDPDFVDVPPVSMASDDHPPADLARGQAFIARLCNVLWSSGHWENLTLLITYDEHGGFYDHVAPPGTAEGDPAWIGKVPKIHPDGADFMGPRVPTFLVSPFVAAGSITHQVFDHSSIIKTILVHNRDRLSRSAFTSFGPRVNAAAHLGVALGLDAPRPRPQAFCTACAVRPVNSPMMEATPAGIATATFGTARRPTSLPTAIDATTTVPLAASGDDVAPTPTAPPTVSIEVEGWDEVPPEPDDFHEGLRRAMAPRRR